MRRLACLLAVMIATGCLTGCSLFVMAGRIIGGDPMIPSDFRRQTGVNLSKDEKSLLVLCSAAEFIKSEVPTLDIDLMESIARRLKRNGVDVVDPNWVSKWMDDRVGQSKDMNELVEEFKADYIANIRVDDFRIREPNSPSMFQGRASGTITVYRVETVDDKPQTVTVFTQGFETTYPKLNPITADRSSPSVFERQFLNHLTHFLARRFHDYRPGEDI